MTRNFTLKEVFAVLMAWSCCCQVSAQSVVLPEFEEGVYVADTIYEYYGPLASSGIGGVDLSPSLQSNFVSGVDFSVVIDSIDQGESPTHAAFKDSSGVMVPMYEGDTLPVSASFRLYAGEIGFHVLMSGTPAQGGESYACDLGFAFTLGNDWYMMILENSSDTCVVKQLQSMHEQAQSSSIAVFSTPEELTLEVRNQQVLADGFHLYSLNGRRVKRLSGISENRVSIARGDLSHGVYLGQFLYKGTVVATAKFAVNP